MKTKYLIAMLAAPIFFTGCSQDELVNSVPGTETVEGTPYGDNLVFNVGDKNDASTRLTTSGAWSAGDRIGMAWITNDYKNSDLEGNEKINSFSTATNVIGNTPLEFVSGSSFKSKTMMFVGTYLSYYPFNEEVKSVGPLKLSVGANQTSKDMADAYNKMIFASDTLSLKAENAGTGKTPAIDMKRLSNMLILDIYLKKADEKMTSPVIQKVELDLQNNSGTSLLAFSGTVVPNKWTTENTQYTKAEGVKKYFKSLVTGKEYLSCEDSKDKGVITVTTTEGLAVSATQPATVYMSFMPSDLSGLDADKSVLKVYTNYGVIEYSVPEATEDNATPAPTMPIYNWDGTKGAYEKDYAGKGEENKGNIVAAFEGADKVAGRLIKKKVVIDLTKVSVDGLTATNATEIRSIVDNWKLKGNKAPAITINVEHPATYQKDFKKNESSGKTAKNIELEALDLSDIPNALTLIAEDTLVFSGATNLAAGKSITIARKVEQTGTDANNKPIIGATKAQSVIFNGNTNIGTLNVDGLIEFNENTTIKGVLTQKPETSSYNNQSEEEVNNPESGEIKINTIKVAAGKTLTIDAGELVSNTESKSKLINAGTISLINSGAINKGVETHNLSIVNYAVKATKPSTTYHEGVINIGNNDSQGYLAGKESEGTNNFENEHGTVRFYNGEFVAPKNGTVIAVAGNAMQFAAAVASNVTTIEVVGEIKFSAFDLDPEKGKSTTAVMKSGSKLNMGTKSVTLGNVVVAENATIEGKELIVFNGDTKSGKLSIKPNATLTVGDNTTINAYTLDLPTSSKLEGNEKTSKVTYKTAGLIGGTYTANVAQKSDLAGVELEAE